MCTAKGGRRVDKASATAFINFDALRAVISFLQNFTIMIDKHQNMHYFTFNTVLV